MYIKIKKKWQFAFEICMVIVGTIIMGFAFSIFLEPNHISTGGFSGLSMIINYILNKAGITFLTTSIIYFTLNIGLFVYAFKTLGKFFAIKALIGIVSFSVFMEIFNFVPQNYVFEPLISAIYGGLLMGTGLGLVVRFGGSTGGSDMIACIVRKKNSHFSIGKVVVLVDIVVIVFSLFVFNNGIYLLPYTIIALMVSLFVTDFVNDGYKQVKAYHIITTKPNAIADKLMSQLYRGCTLSAAKGMYSRQDKFCLVCLVSKFQISALKRIVRETDPAAFVYASPVSEVMGLWKAEIKEEAEPTKEVKKDETKTDETKTDETKTDEIEPKKEGSKEIENNTKDAKITIEQEQSSNAARVEEQPNSTDKNE